MRALILGMALFLGETLWAAGTLDSAFGTNGYVELDFGASAKHGAYDVAVQPDGKIVAVGASGPHPQTKIVVTRFLPNGKLDPSFHASGPTPGVHQISFIPRLNVGQRVSLHPDGKIIVAGKINSTPKAKSIDAVLVRLLPNGELDPSFGNAGKVISPIYSRIPDASRGVFALSNGKILLGCSIIAGWPHEHHPIHRVLIAQFLPDGNLDHQGFGWDGRNLKWVADGIDTMPYHMAVDSQGRAVIAGRVRQRSGLMVPSDVIVYRFEPNGNIDKSFGNSGWVQTPVSQAHDAAYAVGVQPDGSVVVAGETSGFGQTDAIVIRYRPDGSLDPSFGTNGQVRVRLGGHPAIARTLWIDSDSQTNEVRHIGIAGSAVFSSRINVAAARLLPNGKLDTSFGNQGIANFTVPDRSQTEVLAAAQHPDGGIILAGKTQGGGKAYFTIMRLTGK